MHASRMKPWSLRRLTAGERRLTHDVFGDAVDPDRVRIWSPAIPSWMKPRPFVPGEVLWSGREVIVWAHAPADFGAPEAPLYTTSVFIHEMTHVWQAQRGVDLLQAKLRAGDRPSSYAYALPAGCAWDGFNIEQQAMIVQHDFLRRSGGECPYPAEAYQAVLPFRSALRRAADA